MPKLVASLTALTALAAAVLAGIDPWTTFLRGVIAFMVGHLAGTLWEVIFGKPVEEEPVKQEPVIVEADESASEESEEGTESAEATEDSQEAEAA